MAERWTDERMDDLKQAVEGQGRRMDKGFRELRSETAELRKEMNARFDSMQRVLVLFGASMFAATASLAGAVIVSL